MWVCEKCNKEYDDIYGSCYICGTKPVKKKGGFKSFLIGLFSFFTSLLSAYLTALLFGLIMEDIMLDNPVFIQVIIFSSFFGYYYVIKKFIKNKINNE